MREMWDCQSSVCIVLGIAVQEPCEAWVKKCRTAFQMSSVPLTRYAPTLSSSRDRSTNSLPISLSGVEPASGATSRKPL